MKMIVFGIACVAFIIGSLFWYSSTTRDWPEIQARVIKLDNGMGSRHLVEWQYSVDNKSYTGHEYVDGLTPNLKLGQMIEIKHAKDDAGISIAPALQKTKAQSMLGAMTIGAAVTLVLGCFLRFQKLS